MDATGRTGTGPALRSLTFYDAVGGEPTFRRLVARFYNGVAADPPLRALYPDLDLAGATERLTLFLIQYWGGPHTYSETRGHPRLRMRHVPFAVTPDMRDRWLGHMRAAVDELGLDEPYETMLWDYLVAAAHSLVNTLEERPYDQTLESLPSPSRLHPSRLE